QSMQELLAPLKAPYFQVKIMAEVRRSSGPGPQGEGPGDSRKSSDTTTLPGSGQMSEDGKRPGKSDRIRVAGTARASVAKPESGFYGSSRDQWAQGMNDGSDHASDPQEAPLPLAPTAARDLRGLYRAQFDSEPYRPERVDAFRDDAEQAFFDSEQGPEGHAGPYDPQPASNPYEQGRHDLAMGPPELDVDDQIQVALTE